VLRGGRRVATTGRSRALLSDSDEVLITLLYLRQVRPQKVLCDLLGINPVTIGQAIKATRQLLDEEKISITPAVVRYFTRAEDLRAWATGTDLAAHIPAHPTRHALTAPHLTGMSRDAQDTLLEKLIVPYAAAIEQRRHRQRGGNRRAGTRGGVFRQKITDGDRILATISTSAASAPSTPSPNCSTSAKAPSGTRSRTSCPSSTPTTPPSPPPTTATTRPPTSSPRPTRHENTSTLENQHVDSW
jgi:hypothetical protein